MEELRARDVDKESEGMGEADMLFLKGYFYNPENTPVLFGYIPVQDRDGIFNARFFQDYWANADNPKFDIIDRVLKMDIPVRMIDLWQDPCYDGR